MKKVLQDTIQNVKSKKFVEGVSSRWFLSKLPYIIIVIFFAMAYISMRFDCLTAREKITRLQSRLNIVRTDTRAERAMYLSATGESAMLRQANELGLDLHLQEKPPYTLTYSENSLLKWQR